MSSSLVSIEDLAADAVSGLPGLVTGTDAARLLNVTRRTLRRWISKGRIRAMRTDEGGQSKLLVPRGELKRFIAERLAECA